jgi:hypothetical protein
MNSLQKYRSLEICECPVSLPLWNETTFVDSDSRRPLLSLNFRRRKGHEVNQFSSRSLRSPSRRNSFSVSRPSPLLRLHLISKLETTVHLCIVTYMVHISGFKTCSIYLRTTAKIKKELRTEPAKNYISNISLWSANKSVFKVSGIVTCLPSIELRTLDLSVANYYHWILLITNETKCITM